ncbi:MAG: hypothetical protein HY735_09010, partial [Verrucomicrobia bacterium]|nr:hypothetical protein [Verrucomicrobiota bacterium]
MPRVREQFACATNVWWAAAILSVASFLYSINAAAEPPSSIFKEYRQRVWTKDDGLPDNWVHSVVQSRNGYLWIGTRFGLARFDGIKFTTIHHPILARDSAHLYLAEDSAGALWIGTPAGLLRYSDGRFAHFTTEDGLWDNYVLALHIGPSGDIWVGTKGGLNRVRQGQLQRLEMDDWAPGVPKEVGSVFEDKSGRVWIGTETRLLIRDVATWKPRHEPPARSPAFRRSARIEPAEAGTTYPVAPDHGPKARPSGLEALPILDSNERLVSGNIFEDAAGMVWLGSKGSLRQLQ